MTDLKITVHDKQYILASWKHLSFKRMHTKTFCEDSTPVTECLRAARDKTLVAMEGIREGREGTIKIDNMAMSGDKNEFLG